MNSRTRPSIGCALLAAGNEIAKRSGPLSVARVDSAINPTIPSASANPETTRDLIPAPSGNFQFKSCNLQRAHRFRDRRVDFRAASFAVLADFFVLRAAPLSIASRHAAVIASPR